MPPTMRSVYSSMVNRIGYDEDTGELHVQFNTGRTAIYRDVDQKTAREVMNAPSIGEAVNGSVKGRFGFHYADGQGRGTNPG